MSAVLLLADAAKEGKDVVLSMLVVGLVFLAVIGIGEFFDWRQRRRMKARA
jgi:heme/copper-type cytochrome/quinol oxidase subunit 2